MAGRALRKKVFARARAKKGKSKVAKKAKGY